MKGESCDLELSLTVQPSLVFKSLNHLRSRPRDLRRVLDGEVHARGTQSMPNVHRVLQLELKQTHSSVLVPSSKARSPVRSVRSLRS